MSSAQSMVSPGTKLKTYVLLVPTAILLGLAALLGWEARQDYRELLEQEYRLLESHARIADAQVHGILRSADQFFQELARERQHLTPDRLDGFHSSLKRQLIPLPELRSLFFADAQGRIDIYTNDQVRGLDISQREYFQRAREATEPRLIVSRPFVGATGMLIVIICRPIRDAQGKFRGLVGASLDPKYFEEILNTLQAGPTGSNLILNAAGDILYAAPDPQRFAGRNLVGGPGYGEHMAQDGRMTRHRTIAKISGADKLSVFRRIEKSGLIVVISRNAEVVLSPWKRGLVMRSAIFLVALMIILHLSRLAWRQRRLQAVAEARLRNSEAQLSKAQAVAHMGSWQFDIRLNELVWSDETYRLFGIAPGMPLSQALLLERVHPDDRDLVSQAWQDAINGLPYDIEHRIVAEGRTLWVRERAEIVFDATGQAASATGTVQDITDRKQAELQLRLAATVFENSREGVTITDLERRIISVNPAFCTITGYAAEEIIGRNPNMLQSGRHDTAFYQAMWNSINARGYWSGEIWNRRKNGEIYPELLSIAVVKDRLGKPLHYIGVFTDISALKRSEEEIRQLNAGLERRVQERTAELENSNRELESFSYSVSHDLRTPLRSIDGFSHILAEEFGAVLGENGHDHLQRIRAASQRMGELIDDLVTLAQVTRRELKRESVDLSRLATEAARELSESSPQRSVAWSIQPGLVAQGDAGLLKAALVNLLDNAWKFTAGATDARIEFSCTEAGGVKTYLVRDNGIGIDMTYADKLFKPFQRLHDPRQYKGTGIGLAIAHRAIRRHGGSIRAESTPGQGARFLFTLGPADQPRQEAAAVQPSRIGA